MDKSLVVHLPTSLVVDILDKWLCVVDRVRLDSAHCQAAERDEFLQLIRHPQLAVKSWVFDSAEPREIEKTTDKVIKWAIAKDILVDRMSIGANSNLHIYNSFLQQFGRTVSIVKANNISVAELTESLSQCINLTVLNVVNCEISAVALRSVFVNCTNLCEFRCSFWSITVTSHLPKIESNDLDGIECKSWKYLRIDKCRDDALVTALLKMAVNTEVLYLNEEISDEQLDCINPNLNALLLPRAYLSVAAVCRLVSRFSHLAHLCLSYGNDICVDRAQAIGQLTCLKSLDISVCFITSDEVLSVLADVCGHRLTELLLCSCSGITLPEVQSVLPRFTQLTSFSVVYEEQDAEISDLSLLTRFTTLTLIYDGTEAKNFVSDLTKHCATALQHLHLLSHDCSIRSRDLDVLVEKCSKLRSLNYAGEWHMYDELDVVRWREINPKLEVSDVFSVQLTVLRDLDDC